MIPPDRTTVMSVLLGVVVGAVVLTQILPNTKVPEEGDMRDILAWSLPSLNVVGPDGQAVKLEDDRVTLRRQECWILSGDTILARRAPPPRFECVLWITASDGTANVTALGVEHIPESAVAEVNGRRLDPADVGRYRVTELSAEGVRRVLRERDIADPE